MMRVVPLVDSDRGPGAIHADRSPREARPGLRRPRLLVAVTDAMSCTLLHGQLAYARECGFDVALLCSPGGAATQMVEREGLTFLPVSMERSHASYRDLIALGRVCRALRRFRPDIVNAGTPKAGLVVLLAAWICRVPCRIYTLRGLYLETASGWRRWILAMTERLACALAHRVVCVSPSLRALTLQLGLVTSGKAVVLGSGSSNGVDLERFMPTTSLLAEGRRVRAALGIDSDAVVVGFVGRLTSDKGVRELVQAWSDLRQAFTTVHLLIVGAFEDDRLSSSVAMVLKTDRRVHLVGAVGEPAGYYTAMDMVVLPTYREGLPNVVLEAGAMERPVVATAVTGCVDAVDDGVTGALVPPRDAAALAAAVARYVCDADLRMQHGRAGRARVERDFACGRVWDRLHAEYTTLLAAAGLSLPEPGPSADAQSPMSNAPMLNAHCKAYRSTEAIR